MIRTSLYLVFILLASQAIFAQASFPKNWEGQFENDADLWRYATQNGKYVVGTTKKEISVISGVTGKPLWKKTFMDIAGVKEAKSQQVIEETETLLIISKQKGNDELFCVDLKTGNKLWSNDKFNDINLDNLKFIEGANCYAVIQKRGIAFIDDKTGQEKGAIDGINGVIGRYVFNSATKELILFAYQLNPFKAIGSGFKNNLICVDLNTFKTKWNTVVKGMVEIKRLAGKSFSVMDWVTVGVNKGIGASNVLVDLLVKDNKAYVIMNGLQAFDLSNGAKLWEVEYDLSLNRGLGGASQLYNAVADPLFTNDHIYLASFEKGRDKLIKKYDIESGKLLWETPVDGRKVIIPKISIVNGMLVAQIGGFVNLQGENNGSTFSKWEWQGPFGLKGFDAETGKIKWETEKFDDRITNILVKNNELYVADESQLYSINTTNGNKAFEIKLKDTKTGKPQYIFNSGEQIMILGENGLCAFNKKGSQQYAITAKDASMNDSDLFGESLYYLGTDDEMIAVDLINGKEIGRFQFKKGYTYGIKNVGRTFIIYKDNKVTNYNVKSM